MESHTDTPRPLCTRAIPIDPAVRSSESLFLTESSGLTASPSRRLLFVGLWPAPGPVARRMGVPAGTELLVRRRLMLIDGIPVRLACSFFLAGSPESDELERQAFIAGGLQRLFEAHGRRFGRAEETLDARHPQAAERALLEMKPDGVVVELLRTSFDQDERPVHTLRSACVAERHRFIVGQMPGDGSF